jgi:hypothetical protein
VKNKLNKEKGDNNFLCSTYQLDRLSLPSVSPCFQLCGAPEYLLSPGSAGISALGVYITLTIYLPIIKIP